ncbi:BON domain-containing protein [Pseudomonas sp. NW5]|uniref:BON domain-containing protein n=1 Tax=Pseudomonas sp. NW5 TaxID=2934934 RepID=UPI00202257B9|nr:BON domain-containing protein [Pseudomonas sp. NW5]MCL7461512.1 BON domain-containing protein [Pseudomonas sp. NW5]
MKRYLSLLLATTLLLAGCGGRSLGNKIDDQFLAPRVSSEIARSHADLNDTTSHVTVVSYNGVVLLAGQTPRAELRQLAEQTASRVQGVRRVHNELQVMPPSSALARSSDALLTTRIKAAMLADNTVPGSRIKVVTENGNVFLLGLVTRAEAQRATQVVQGVGGVQRIVRLFEFTD